MEQFCEKVPPEGKPHHHADGNHRRDHHLHDHAYILIVNPSILSATGMDKGAC